MQPGERPVDWEKLNQEDERGDEGARPDADEELKWHLGLCARERKELNGAEPAREGDRATRFYARACVSRPGGDEAGVGRQAISAREATQEDTYMGTANRARLVIRID